MNLFVYSFIYKFIGCFVLVVLWNAISPWKPEWWGSYFFVITLVIPSIAAAITTVWFGICGTRDMFRLFKDLENRVNDPLVNGMVDGHVSLADKAKMEALDKEKAE
jgi:hypothetical protein